jgi:hypothetical protein
MANHGRADVADQIRGKNEAATQRNDYVYPSPSVFPVYLAAHRCHP